MVSDLLVSVGVIFLLFFVGAIFSAAEMSLVTLRDAQISKLAARGKRGRAITALTSNPNRFLSSVQIGVTLAGFLSSAFGSDSLAGKYLAPWLAAHGLSSGLASTFAVILVTAAISFFSIVLSELTAKRLAMQRPEEFAMALAPVINTIAKAATPLIWMLDKSTNIVVRIFGGDPQAGKDEVTEEELRSMVANADSLGEEERRIVDDVFEAGDRSLREVMVPRTEVDFLAGDLPVYQAIQLVRDNQRSRYPVTDGTADQIAGFLHVRDLMGLDASERQTPVRDLARPVFSLPETVKVINAMSQMRRAGAHLAMVRDEYGGTAGIVTLEDLIEELIGEITDEFDIVEPSDLVHEGASDIEGLTSLEDFAERTGFLIPEGPYDTLAGYFMAVLGRVPVPDDRIVVDLLPVEADENGEQLPVTMSMRVSEMDGRRISWVDLARVPVLAATVE